MVIDVLNTKLFRPPLPGWIVPRQRLVEKFKEGLLSCRVTLISAPAGFGKTTFLSECICVNHFPYCWVSLDEDDNDPVRFWIHLMTALEGVFSQASKSALKMMRSQQSIPLRTVLTGLINSIAQEDDLDDVRCVLILDDYHLIKNERIHRNIDFMIDHLPQQIHLVITSRIDPPLSLARLRGRGHLSEFNSNDLRFTLEETGTFLEKAVGPDLSEEIVGAMASNSDGWIASLQMAAVSMRSRHNNSAGVDAFSDVHGDISEYLLKEVLHHQDLVIQDFLLQTSILERLSGPLCDAVTGKADSQQRLEQIRSANLFLTPLDSIGTWYTYHQLFSSLLRRQLAQTKPTLISVLHCRASDWFEKHGLMGEAIHHAIEANDFERASSLIEKESFSTLAAYGNLSQIRSWIDRLPSDLVTKKPWISLSLACIHMMAGRQREMEEALVCAESACLRNEDELSSSGETAVIKTYVVSMRATSAWMKGDTMVTIEYCREALNNMLGLPPTITCWLKFNLGAAYWLRGELEASDRYLNETIDISYRSTNYYIGLSAMALLADNYLKRGQLEQAVDINREAIRLGKVIGNGNDLPSACCAYMGMAHIMYHRDRYDAAYEFMIQGINLSNYTVEYMYALLGVPGSALLNHFRDETNASIAEVTLRIIANLARDLESHALWGLSDTWYAILALAGGNLEGASRHLADAGEHLNTGDIPRPFVEFHWLIRARLCIAQGQTGGLPVVLGELARTMREDGRNGSMIEVLLLQCIALEVQGRMDESLRVLNNAVSIAYPEGYIRIFLDEGIRMERLVSLALSRDPENPALQKLLLAFKRNNYHVQQKGGEGAAQAPPCAWDKLFPDESAEDGNITFSDREIEVMQLMAQGKTNQEIAGELIISIGTVKKHTNNIYTKLEVNNRTSAVLKAKQLQLIK